MASLNVTRYSSPYWCSMLNIRELASMVPEENVTEIFLYYAYQNYFNFRQTGSWQAADSKLSYTIQFSIQMLCAKYQKAGLHGSWEKCDRNFSVLGTYQNYFKFRQTGSWQVLHGTVLHTDALRQISESWPAWFLRRMWQKFFYIMYNQNYCKFRQTGSWQAAGSKLSYTI